MDQEKEQMYEVQFQVQWTKRFPIVSTNHTTSLPFQYIGHTKKNKTEKKERNKDKIKD